MDTTTLIEAIHAALPEVSLERAVASDQPTLYLSREQLLATCRVLRDVPSLDFSLLADLTAVDIWPKEPRFEVVYHLVSLGSHGASAEAAWPGPTRLRIKVRVSSDETVPTVSRIWASANWLEREVWDLFGIVFDDHPDLRRLLLPDDWEGFPLRKDHPVQVAVKARTGAPLGLTLEEFTANIRAARQHSVPAPSATGGGPPAPSGGEGT